MLRAIGFPGRYAQGPDALALLPVLLADATVRAGCDRVVALAAGMGDALSKQCESQQCFLAQGHNFFGTPSLPTARLLAERCHDTIIEFGEAALRQVATAQRPDEAVERVVEATVLLSGIGFESGGPSLAHALVRGFSAHPVLGRFLHGEVVAFGTLVQLVAEGRARAEVAEHAAFVKRLGLPTTFAGFGIAATTAHELDKIARITCTAPYISHLRPTIAAAGVRAAFETAVRIGSENT